MKRKKRHIVLMLTLCALVVQSAAQSNKDIRSYRNSTEMVDAANKKVIKAPLDAFQLATEAIVLSKKNKDKRGEASAYNTLGTLYFNAGEYTKAIEYFTKAKDIYKSISDDKSEEYSLKYLGKSYEAINEKDKSIDYYSKAEQKSNSDYTRGNYRISNSKIKKAQGRTDEAISDLERELKLNASLDPEQKIDIYLELGDLYIERKDTSKGIELIEKALSTSKTTKNDTVGVSTLNSAWQIYSKNGLKEKNLETQQKYLDSTKEVTPVVESAVNYNSGNILLSTDAKAATKFFERSAELSKNANAQLDRIKAVEKLSEAYEKSGEYSKALEQYKLYIKLVDSIKLREIASQVQNEMLATKYEVQESKIRELELKQEEKEAAIRRQRWMIGLLGVGLVLFSLLTYFLVKNIREKQRSNMQIRLASLRSQMNPHFIFNSLNSVNGFISQNEEIKANRYLSDFSKLMRTVLNNSHNESIPLDDELKSLEIYLSLEHSRFPDKFEYQLEVDAAIQTRDIEVPPMLIQPYIENAVWHGLRYRESKGLLLVKLEQKGKVLCVTITDNGIGREKSQELKTTHQKDYKSTAMSNTKERLALLNKLYKQNYEVEEVDINDGEQTGTKVILKLPINA